VLASLLEGGRRMHFGEPANRVVRGQPKQQKNNCREKGGNKKVGPSRGKDLGYWRNSSMITAKTAGESRVLEDRGQKKKKETTVNRPQDHHKRVRPSPGEGDGEESPHTTDCIGEKKKRKIGGHANLGAGGTSGCEISRGPSRRGGGEQPSNKKRKGNT